MTKSANLVEGFNEFFMEVEKSITKGLMPEEEETLKKLKQRYGKGIFLPSREGCYPVAKEGDSIRNNKLPIVFRRRC